MLKRIPVAAVRVGMFVHEFCGSWLEHPFWRSSFLLTERKDLERIRSCGIRELWIDTDRGLDVPDGEPDGETAAQVEARAEERLLAVECQSSPVSQASLDEEIARAHRLCTSAKPAVMRMFRDMRMGRAVQLEQIGALVEEISESVLRHPHALISLARLKTADEYTYMHSVAVCAMMIALARQLGMTEQQVHEAGLAGLLHDVGETAIPPALLNKTGTLSDTEFARVRDHSRVGAQALMEGGQVSASVIDVCLHHHERIDGTGYPDRLAGEQLSLLARMGAVCDVYDAITSARPYKKAWDPSSSLRKMAEWQGHFDERVFQAFVKTVGIYPIGSLVKLESGRLGVVIEQHEQSLLTPKVRVFFSARLKMPLSQQTLDLAKLAGRDWIVSRESVAKWGFRDLDVLWRGLL